MSRFRHVNRPQAGGDCVECILISSATGSVEPLRTILEPYEPGLVRPFEDLPSDGRPAELFTCFAFCHTLSRSRPGTSIGCRVAPAIRNHHSVLATVRGG